MTFSTPTQLNTGGRNGVGVAAVPIATSQTVAVGDLLNVAVGSSVISGLNANWTATDNLGNTWTNDKSVVNGTSLQGAILSSRVTVAGSLTSVTITPGNSCNNIAAVVSYTAGGALSSPVDQSVSATGSSVSATATTATQTGSNDVEIALIVSPTSSTLSAQSPTVLGNAVSTSGSLDRRASLLYSIASGSTAAVSASATLSASSAWAVVIVTYKAAASGLTGAATATATATGTSAGAVGAVGAGTSTATATGTAAGATVAVGGGTTVATATASAAGTVTSGVTGGGTSSVTAMGSSAGFVGKVSGATSAPTAASAAAGFVGSSGGATQVVTATSTAGGSVTSGFTGAATSAVTATGSSAGFVGRATGATFGAVAAGTAGGFVTGAYTGAATSTVTAALTAAGVVSGAALPTFLFTPNLRHRIFYQGGLRGHVDECATAWQDATGWHWAFTPFVPGGWEPAGVLHKIRTPTVVSQATATALVAIGAGTIVQVT